MKIQFKFLLPLLVVLLLTSCVENTNEEDGKGNITIQLTDAPFPVDLIQEANVTIDKIEIRKKGDSLQSPFVLLYNNPMSFNLLELSNGVTDSLVDMDIDEGSYDLIRLYVSEASILLKDSTLYDVEVPGGAESGIKIFVNPDIEISSIASTELILDFDVSK